MYRIILLVCGLASIASSFPATFDNVNVDSLLAKPEVVDAYIDCLLENAACTESGLRLKAITPNALLEKCSKCTPYQRESVQKISKAISTKKPAEWVKILDKYDPSSQHRSEIESLVNAKSAELEKPADAKREEAPKPAEAAARPEELPKPAELEKLAEPKPAELEKLAEPKPAGLEKLAEPKPADFEKLAEPKPAEPEKLAESAKPADLAKKPEALSS